MLVNFPMYSKKSQAMVTASLVAREETKTMTRFFLHSYYDFSLHENKVQINMCTHKQNVNV